MLKKYPAGSFFSHRVSIPAGAVRRGGVGMSLRNKWTLKESLNAQDDFR